MTVKIDDIVTLLSKGISRRQIYFSDHPEVVAHSEEFTRKLKLFLIQEGQVSFFLGVADRQLIYNGHYLLGASIIGCRIVDLMEDLQCGGILFLENVEPREIRDLFGLVVDLPAPPASLGEAQALLGARSIRHIELSPLFEDPQWLGQEMDVASPMVDEENLSESAIAMIPTYQSLYGTVENAHNKASGDGSVNVDAARATSERMIKTMGDSFMDIMQLVNYPDFDSYTLGHSVRVAMLAVLMGKYLEAPPGLVHELGTAALLHDIGKSRVPEEIIFKPGRLTAHERQLIERHPVEGARILLAGRNASPLTISAAWGHHRRYDYKGYPASPPWAIRNDATALLQICDVYEALTAVRPYKRAFSPRRAYEIMLFDKGAFHPGLLRAFIAAMGLYPAGSRVRLSSGERGVVLSAGGDIQRPKIEVTHELDGSPASPRRRIDLESGEAAELEVSQLLITESDAGERAPTPAA